MNTSSAQKLKIGIFVVAGFLLLVAGIFLIGSRQNLFSSTYRIYGSFRNAGGLQEGNNIRFGGVDIGTVQRIRILSDTIVRVDMSIRSEMRRFIRRDAVVSIGSDGLMGDKLLLIEPGTSGAPVLDAGDQIRTVEPVDLGSIINKFTRVAENAEVITGTLAGMALEIRDGNGSVNRLLYHDDLARGLEGSVSNLQAITGSLQGIAAQVQSGEGSLGALIYTDSLAKGLDRTIVSANAALSTVQTAADHFSENMKALQGNFFFRGYFRKKARAQVDSLSAAAPEETEMTDAELEQIREEADRELQRRKKGGADAPDKKARNSR